MTQATDTSEVLKRLDKLITDIQDIKLSQARTEEQVKSLSNLTEQRFNAIDQRLGSLEDGVKAQDNRVWGILVAVLGTALGLAAKLAFFPVEKL